MYHADNLAFAQQIINFEHIQNPLAMVRDNKFSHESLVDIINIYRAPLCKVGTTSWDVERCLNDRKNSWLAVYTCNNGWLSFFFFLVITRIFHAIRWVWCIMRCTLHAPAASLLQYHCMTIARCRTIIVQWKWWSWDCCMIPLHYQTRTITEIFLRKTIKIVRLWLEQHLLPVGPILMLQNLETLTWEFDWKLSRTVGLQLL